MIAHKLFTRKWNSMWTRVFSIFERRRPAIANIFLSTGLINSLLYLIFKKYIGKIAHKRKLCQLAAIRKKDQIVVVFQVISLGKWKCDSVYQEMRKSSKFRPIIWIMEGPGYTKEDKDGEYRKLISHFSNLGYNYTTVSTWNDLDKEIKPDLVFIYEPYNDPRNMPPNIDNRLLCYVRYGLPNTISRNSTNLFLHNFSLFYFCESYYIANTYANIMQNSGQNIIITGHPFIDYLQTINSDDTSVWKPELPSTKKLIWAPHWTTDQQSFFAVSTFLTIYQDMINIAKKYNHSLHIAFKPHPNLYSALCKHPDWGKEKTDAYYHLWATMPNTQLETGEYRELFQQSDAMIHDCGSFILEYLLMDKPCMYLQRSERYSLFNTMNLEALECYTIGKTIEDIERFIVEQVLGGQDPNDGKRRDFCEKYLIPPHGKTAAENIIDAILGNEPYN